MERILDSISYKILKILQEKARIPNAEVARQVELAPSAVLERIRKLEKQGIIDGYEVRLNPKQFRCSEIAFIHIEVDANKLEKIEEDLCKIIEIQEIHRITGSDTLFLKIRCENSKALDKILFKTIRTIPGVLSTRTEQVVKTIKETSRVPLYDDFNDISIIKKKDK